jgi:hypothetical protein
MYSFGVMMEQMLNHCTKAFWPMFEDPQNVVIDVQYKGLGLTDVLKSMLQINASDRGDFSGFTGEGMLWNVLRFREKRSAMLKNGESVDRSYWVAKR